MIPALQAIFFPLHGVITFNNKAISQVKDVKVWNQAQQAEPTLKVTYPLFRSLTEAARFFKINIYQRLCADLSLALGSATAPKSSVDGSSAGGAGDKQLSVYNRAEY